MKLIQVCAAVLGLSAALHADAQCPAEFPVEQPDIPDGAKATRAQMLKVQGEVSSFIAQGEAYLACRTQPKWLVQSHNSYVTELEAVATAYNIALNAFASAERVAKR